MIGIGEWRLGLRGGRRRTSCAYSKARLFCCDCFVLLHTHMCTKYDMHSFSVFE